MDLENIPSYMIVNGIIAFLGEDFEIKQGKLEFCSNFYRLAKKDKYKSILREFHFSNNEYNESLRIISIFDNLLISRLIGIDGINNQFIVSKGFNNIYNRRAEKYFGEHEDLIRNASRELKNYLTKK